MSYTLTSVLMLQIEALTINVLVVKLRVRCDIITTFTFIDVNHRNTEVNVVMTWHLST